jgi:hypothetical protein
MAFRAITLNRGLVRPGAGDMANSSDACYNAPYELKDFDSEPRALRARTDGRGRIWLFAGTESGFESRTRIYITRMRADLQRVN